MDSVGEGEGGKIWENGIETCILPCMKRVASPGSMHDTRCLGLVHWDDPEGWYGERGGRGVQDGCTHVLHPEPPLTPPSPYHPFGSSQCISPKHPVSCIEPGLAIRFTYDNIHVSMPFSQIIPPSPCPTESKRLFYTSVSLLLSCI